MVQPHRRGHGQYLVKKAWPGPNLALQRGKGVWPSPVAGGEGVWPGTNLAPIQKSGAGGGQALWGGDSLVQSQLAAWAWGLETWWWGGILMTTTLLPPNLLTRG